MDNKMDAQSDGRSKSRKGNSSTSQSLHSPSNSSHGGGGSKSVPYSSTGRPPTTTMLRSAMYYQNRIIVPEVKTRPYQPNTYSAGNNQSTNGNRLSSDQMNGPNNSNSAIYRTTKPGGITSAQATSSFQLRGAGADNNGFKSEMDPRGVDIVVTDTEGNKQHKVKKKTIWRKIIMCLQDNRMKGNPDADLILAGSNPQEYRILKKVLNIIFLTIGTALLISVIIVVIYTAVAGE